METRTRWALVTLLFIGGAISYMDRAALSITAPLIAKNCISTPRNWASCFRVFRGVCTVLLHRWVLVGPLGPQSCAHRVDAGLVPVLRSHGGGARDRESSLRARDLRHVRRTGLRQHQQARVELVSARPAGKCARHREFKAVDRRGHRGTCGRPSRAGDELAHVLSDRRCGERAVGRRVAAAREGQAPREGQALHADRGTRVGARAGRLPARRKRAARAALGLSD